MHVCLQSPRSLPVQDRGNRDNADNLPAIVLITKLLPRSLHVGTIGFGTAFGGSGGAVFPFIVGAIAQKKGVKTLQPIILALLAAIAALWVCMPRGGGKDHESRGESEGQELGVDGAGQETVSV
jgi:hypothetical protein